MPISHLFEALFASCFWLFFLCTYSCCEPLLSDLQLIRFPVEAALKECQNAARSSDVTADAAGWGETHPKSEKFVSRDIYETWYHNSCSCPVERLYLFSLCYMHDKFGIRSVAISNRCALRCVRRLSFVSSSAYGANLPVLEVEFADASVNCGLHRWRHGNPRKRDAECRGWLKNKPRRWKERSSKFISWLSIMSIYRQAHQNMSMGYYIILYYTRCIFNWECYENSQMLAWGYCCFALNRDCSGHYFQTVGYECVLFVPSLLVGHVCKKSVPGTEVVVLRHMGLRRS